MILRFLAVERKRHICTEISQSHRGRRSQRDALVRRPEQHIELDAALCTRLQQRLCIKPRQPPQRGAAIEQAGVEKVRRQPARLGLELTERQHLAGQCKLDKLLS